MRQWIDLFEAASQDDAFWEKYNLGGCWVLPDGSIREVDHRAGIHHGEIALQEFREHISHNEDGEFDKYSTGEAMKIAMEEGWVQVSIRTPDKGLTVGYHPPMSAQAKRTVVRFIRDQPEHMSYEIFTTDAPFVVMNSKNEIMSKMSRVALGEAMIVRDQAASDHDNEMRDLVIHHNPGRNDLAALLANSREKTLRGFIDEKAGDIYVWDAYVTDHGGADEMMRKHGYNPPFPRFIIELENGVAQAFAYLDHGMKEEDWLDANTTKMDRALGHETIWRWT